MGKHFFGLVKHKDYERKDFFMRKLNKFISAFVVSVVCFVMSLLISTNCTYIAEAAEEIQDISAADAAVVTDNSDLSVRVVLCSNGEQSTIFTGKLKNYDNGRWVGLDFSEVQSWAIVNWGILQTMCGVLYQKTLLLT